jgi:hypothetical protein
MFVLSLTNGVVDSGSLAAKCSRGQGDVSPQFQVLPASIKAPVSPNLSPEKTKH